MKRVFVNSFHEDPAGLWQGPMLVTWGNKAARKMPPIDQSSVAQAYRAALYQRITYPLAAQDVLAIGDDDGSSDEEEGMAPIHPPRQASSARARGSKRK